MKKTALSVLACLGAIAIVTWSSAQALPNGPVKHCQQKTTCVTVAATPCIPIIRHNHKVGCVYGTGTPHQQCTTKTFCSDA